MSMNYEELQAECRPLRKLLRHPTQENLNSLHLRLSRLLENSGFPSSFAERLKRIEQDDYRIVETAIEANNSLLTLEGDSSGFRAALQRNQQDEKRWEDSKHLLMEIEHWLQEKTAYEKEKASLAEHRYRNIITNVSMGKIWNADDERISQGCHNKSAVSLLWKYLLEHVGKPVSKTSILRLILKESGRTKVGVGESDADKILHNLCKNKIAPVSGKSLKEVQSWFEKDKNSITLKSQRN